MDNPKGNLKALPAPEIETVKYEVGYCKLPYSHGCGCAYTLDQCARSDDVHHLVAADCGHSEAALFLAFHPSIGVEAAQRFADRADADVVVLPQSIELKFYARRSAPFHDILAHHLIGGTRQGEAGFLDFDYCYPFRSTKVMTDRRMGKAPLQHDPKYRRLSAPGRIMEITMRPGARELPSCRHQ